MSKLLKEKVIESIERIGPENNELLSHYSILQSIFLGIQYFNLYRFKYNIPCYLMNNAMLIMYRGTTDEF